MSVRAMSHVWDESPVGGSDLLLLLAIADCANDEGRNAWPSVATLARKCRVDTRTVQRTTRRLVEGGHLIVEAAGGGRGANRYAIPMNPRQDATPGDSPPVTPAPPQPRRSRVTAPPAQLRRPNVLDPSSIHPPRECPRHIGKPAHNCGLCRSERLAVA